MQRKRKKSLLFILLGFWAILSCPLTLYAQTITLKNISQNTQNKFWTVVLTSSEGATIHHFMLTHPDRWVIDISGATAFQNAMPGAALAATPVQSVRSAVHSPGQLRLVLDLRKTGKIDHFNVTAVRAQKAQSKPKPGLALQTPITVPAPKRLRPIMVVIDPGHGGKDPGASGQKNTHEKRVVLDIAQKLEYLINQQPGFKAVLTRDADYYLTLRQRLNIAREHKADMFIAIHADAYADSAAHGFSVFALSQRGASSEAARWLAARENRSELMGGVGLADKENILRSVLINLSQSATISSSLAIGQNLLENVHSFAHLHHDQTEQAAFVVLKSPDIPSLLVETGFLSNQQEEGKLTDRNYQLNLARAMMLGIKQYFLKRPPPGTWLAAQQDNHYKNG